MKEVVKIKNSEIKIDESGSVTIPMEVQIRVIGKRNLKAVAKITYAGIVINDISILENRGHIDIVFPQKTFVQRGIEKRSTIVFPGVSNLSSQFNHAILKAYSEAILDQGVKI